MPAESTGQHCANPGIQSLSCVDSVPQQLPMQLRHLDVQVRPGDCDEDVPLFEALIALLHTCPSLRTLVLDAECLCCLSSSSTLPRLEKLEMHWDVYGADRGSLSWLQVRLPGQLDVHVTLYNIDDEHVDICCQALQQLQDLPIHLLRTDIDDDEPDYHDIWESPYMKDTTRALRPKKLQLHFLRYIGVILALQLFHSIKASGSEPRGHGGHDLVVNWAVMTRQSGRLLFCLHEQDLQVASYAPLPHTFGPWQLLSRHLGPWQHISGKKDVHGLPPSRPTSAAYFMQNAAADAAGWHSSLEPLGHANDAQGL